MDQQISNAELYQRFIKWQCRLRKQSMRELEGRPGVGMSAGIHAVTGGEEQSLINFLIVKQSPEEVNAEFAHIVRKSQDPAEWVKNGLRILAERYYQDDFDFSNDLSALFALESPVADALVEAQKCQLQFKQDSIDYAFDFAVRELDEQDSIHQATYWHNRLFNPALPGKVRVLAFSPLLT